MSEEIKNLEPKGLWKNFYALTRVPRPSKHEEKIQEFVKGFCEDLGLETIIDEVGNIIARKPATPGMENKKGVILQAHLDMVPQKNSDTSHDFEKDPIDAYIDGEWVKAKGTTLGSDNGIGAAAAMAVLESDDLEHGPIEALFTSDEETGMTGANGLKPGLINGEILLNMDSEDEGELYIGCAGGIDTIGIFNFKEKKAPAGHTAYKVSLTGLKGGHSGLDIHLGRGNANKIMNKLLMEAGDKFGLRLSSIDGGSLRNAIPRESFAIVTIPEDKKDEFEAFVTRFEKTEKEKYSKADPGLAIKAEPVSMPAHVIDEYTQEDLLRAIDLCPNGVTQMNKDMPDVVDTSTNLAIVKSRDGYIEASTLTRGASDDEKHKLANTIYDVFNANGGKASFSGDYPGWKPNVNSPILNTMKKVYNDHFGKVPEVKVIHAGLECGILGSKYPHWDMISFGPTIRNPHSPDEMVNIPTVKKFWDYLLHTLREVPEKS